MSTIKIRKNAYLKIQNLLAASVGVISRSSTSRIDDDYDNEYVVSSGTEALAWLRDNQERAQVYLEIEDGHQVLRISGRYGFERAFMAYFNKSQFDKDIAWFTNHMEACEPALITPAHAQPHLYLVS
ncbi:TPA: hypothetical protein MD292_002628 [Klebsiella aerogenes]|nr:hypothetical protein [Klebsiella aerogenes]